jgi:hypothetical protein
VAVRHAADHIHIVATLARQDGGRPRVWNDFFRVREACLAEERWFGLQRTAPADRTAARRVTRAEAEQAARRGWAEPVRVTLRREVCAAAAGAGTERGFFARLQRAGVMVRLRHSTTAPGQVTGYAVGLPGHTTRDGAVVWYGGGKLAADLTLPKLRARWAGPRRPGTPAGPEAPAVVVRADLRGKVSGAAARARDEESFFTALRQDGVQVRARYSEINPGEVTGYSVSLPGCTGPDGTPQWYGGGRLAAWLTLPRLRCRWAQAWGTGPEHSGMPWCTAAERDEIYRHAARQAAMAAQHIRRCTVGDPASAGDVAWAAADALHAAAQAVQSRSLRRAADAFGRAARPQDARTPARSGDGDRLRLAARLLACVGQAAGEQVPAALTLAVQLADLVTSVAELRRVQQHAAQAAAAWAAAGHLHAGITRASARVPHQDSTQAPRPARATGGAIMTRDFPAGPVPASPLTTDTAGPGRHYQVVLPRRRAGPAP